MASEWWVDNHQHVLAWVERGSWYIGDIPPPNWDDGEDEEEEEDDFMGVGI